MTALSPLDVAVNAMWDSVEGGGSDLPPPDGPTNGEREHFRRKVRAALLALSDAPLPGQVLNEGAMALTLEGPQRIKASQAFSAMLRKIAEARP